MAEGFFYLVQWEDRFMGIISKRDIVAPVKPNYSEGDFITAKYEKRTYEAVISEIHPNRKFLHQQSKLPPKHSYVSSQRERRTQDENQSSLPMPSTSGSSPVKSGPSVPPTSGFSTVKSSLPMPSTSGSSPVKSGPSVPPTSGFSTVESSLPMPSTSGSSPVKSGPSVPPTSGSSTVNKRKESSWEEECRSLRRKIRKLEERVEEIERSDRTNSTMDEERKAKDLVEHLPATDHSSVVKILARHIFSEDELRNCSRTGKKTIKCLNDVPRPSLDREKFSTLERLVLTKTCMPKDVFLKKFENLQKVLRRK